MWAVAGVVLAVLVGAACTGTAPEVADHVRGDARLVDRVGGDVPSEEREDLEAVFEEAGVEGTFVLFDTGERSATVVAPGQARRRTVPASTFTLVSSVIALQTGAVADVDEVVPHGGGPQPVPGRERGMSMREALPASNAPVYREIARRVGHDRMAAWVDRFDYGNRAIGDEERVDRFWSEGPLEVSPMEQTAFLASLARAELPVEDRHLGAVREIARVDRIGDHALFAETGWGATVEPSPGWWVGWVEHGEDVHTFALRVYVEDGSQLESCERIGRELLVELGVLPPEAAR
ncbi:penicillin-binding transpeptidase domain-containing protein [Nocardiopsis sp. NPDC049922]|uniref:penicillin-binding transpeptidase domain-containing protein n=1 Tax=Nocardiopsis sp. NPDC049922 TaxID=3155157 RepID=UPI0033E6E536